MHMFDAIKYILSLHLLKAPPWPIIWSQIILSTQPLLSPTLTPTRVKDSSPDTTLPPNTHRSPTPKSALSPSIPSQFRTKINNSNTTNTPILQPNKSPTQYYSPPSQPLPLYTKPHAHTNYTIKTSPPTTLQDTPIPIPTYNLHSDITPAPATTTPNTQPNKHNTDTITMDLSTAAAALQATAAAAAVAPAPAAAAATTKTPNTINPPTPAPDLAAFFATPITEQPTLTLTNNSHAATTSTATAMHTSTIDLSTVDDHTHTQILQLINTPTTAPPTHATTQLSAPPTSTIHSLPSSYSYATAAATPATTTTTPNNTSTNNTTAPPIQLPADYNSDIDDMNDDDDDDDNDDTPFILVRNKNKQPKSKQNNNPSSPTKHGISGVKAATTLLWNDKAAQALMNSDDLHRQTTRIVEGRKPNVNSIIRPVIWVKFWFPIEMPDSTFAPNILQQELAVDHIIAKSGLDFIVDRVYIGTLINPIQNSNNNTLSFLGFAALSPRTTNTASNIITKTALNNLYTLEDRLYLITTDKNNYQADIAAIPLLKYIIFKLPNLNNYTEEITFLIEGLHPNIPNNDTATLRELATDIFRAIHKSYNDCHPHTKPSTVLQRHSSRFSINQILSIRQLIITPPKTKTTGHHNKSPQPKPTGKDTALILVIDPNSPSASELEQIIISLSDNNITLSICGGNIDVNLIHFSKVPSQDSKHRNQFYQQLRNSNLQHYARTNVRIIREVPIHPRILSNPEHINILVQHIDTCRALIPNLANGRKHPTLTCLLNFSTDQTTSNPEAIFQLIANTAYSLLNIDITPTPSLQQQHQSSATTTNTTTTAPSNNYVGFTLPKTVNTTSTAPRFYVIINASGGLATAGIYKGHFDDNNL